MPSYFIIFEDMNENLDPTGSSFSHEELEIERALRPVSFDDFTGQQQVLDNLKIFVQAANLRNEALDHTLFSRTSWLRKNHISPYSCP